MQFCHHQKTGRKNFAQLFTRPIPYFSGTLKKSPALSGFINSKTQALINWFKRYFWFLLGNYPQFHRPNRPTKILRNNPI